MGRRSKGSRAAGRVRAVLVTLVALLALAAAAAAALAWVAWRWVDAPLPLAAPTVAYTVAAGSTPRAVAAGWSKSGVDVDPRWLYAWFRLSGDASRIRAGHYEIAQGTTPRRLLEVMVQGLEALERVRLPEGQTLREWRAVLAASPQLVPDSAALDERALMAALDPRIAWAAHLGGLLVGGVFGLLARRAPVPAAYVEAETIREQQVMG